jgi:hypothetical protein
MTTASASCCLHVAFSVRNDLPIDVHICHEGSVAMCTFDLCVEVIRMKLAIRGKDNPISSIDTMTSVMLRCQFECGLYDTCVVQHAGRSWSIRECRAMCDLANKQRNVCQACGTHIQNLSPMPALTMRGSDNINRIACWQKCWSCQSTQICADCIRTCDECRGTFCKTCKPAHVYNPTLMQATCEKCHKNLVLEIAADVCGFEADPDLNYWMQSENASEHVCMDCFGCT